MHTKALLSIYILLSFATVGLSDLDGWPAKDVPPPPMASWTALVDFAPISSIPLENITCTSNIQSCSYRCNSECTRSTDILRCPRKNDWGLTFDDGPSIYTSALLDYLASKNLKVTFNVVGSRIVEHPEILKRAFDAGHEIAVHTWSHNMLTTQSNEQVIAEIKWTELLIKNITGITPRYMRPPYGDIDDRIRGIMQQLNYTPVIWDLDTSDWLLVQLNSTRFDWITGNFSSWVQTPSTTGHISLQHDLYNQTVTLVPNILSILQNGGYNVTPVAACLSQVPYVENLTSYSGGYSSLNNGSNDTIQNKTTTVLTPHPSSSSAPSPSSLSSSPSSHPSSSSHSLERSITCASSYVLYMLLFVVTIILSHCDQIL